MALQYGPSPGKLCLIAGLAAAAVAALELERRMAQSREAAPQREAIEYFQRGAQAIAQAAREKGLAPDPSFDPRGTFLIGRSWTSITTDEGDPVAKQLSTREEFAGIVVEMLQELKLAPGDVVAVGMTGSFPGLNLAVLGASKALGLRPLVIVSVGASRWGANDPRFTWVDMANVLKQSGVCEFDMLAVSLGGRGDRAKGLTSRGRHALLRAARRSGAPVLVPPSGDVSDTGTADEPRGDSLAGETPLGWLSQSVRTRIELYEQAASGQPIRAYINVGGSVASVGIRGSHPGMPEGIVRSLPIGFPLVEAQTGVVGQMTARGIPVVNLDDVRKIWRTYHPAIPGSQYERTPRETTPGAPVSASLSRRRMLAGLLLLAVAGVTWAFVWHPVSRRRRSAQHAETSLSLPEMEG